MTDSKLRVLTIRDLTELREVTFDVSTLTLGEAAEAERSSGWSIGEIAKSRTAMRVLAMFVHGLRHYDVRPSWSELSSLRALDAWSSTSSTPGDGPSPTSSDSPSGTSPT